MSHVTSIQSRTGPVRTRPSRTPEASRACLGEAVIEQIRQAVAAAIDTGTVLDVAETATRIAGACRAEPGGVAEEMIETGLKARINMLMARPGS